MIKTHTKFDSKVEQKIFSPFGSYTLPTEGLLFKILYPNIVDTIGLLITRDQVDESIADIFFNGETKRDDADIVILALASPLLNEPGGTLYGDADAGVLLYAIGAQPVESAERRLWKYLFDTQFEPLYVDSNVLKINNYAVYAEV